MQLYFLFIKQHRYGLIAIEYRTTAGNRRFRRYHACTMPALRHCRYYNIIIIYYRDG